MKEFEPAVNAAARMRPSPASYYIDHERTLYELAAHAAWRRGDRLKSMDYSVPALKGRGKHKQGILAILLNVVKGQPPEDVILFFNSIFNISVPGDLDFLIKGTCVDGFLEVHSYYLKKRMDSGDAYIGDYLRFLLIHKKYDALAPVAAEAHSAGDTDAALYLFLATVCGASPDGIEPNAGMLEKYTRVLNAYKARERLAEVSEADSSLLQETYNTVAFVAGLETADRYLRIQGQT